LVGLEHAFETLPSFPQLVILRQDSLAQQNVSKDGVQKNVHVVVKNTAFKLVVGLSGDLLLADKTISFSNCRLDASLLFDSDEGREVPFVKCRPIEYRGTFNSRADQMEMEVRIKVLSSQCERMFFRIKLSLVDDRTGELVHPSLVAVSQPIHVISKPDQITKKDQPKDRKRKRTPNDDIIDRLNALEQVVQTSNKLLEKFAHHLPATGCPVPDLANDDPGDADLLAKSFAGFLALYNRTPPEERPAKIRKIIRNSSSHVLHEFAGVIGLFNTEGLARELGMGCCCGDGCPYKSELERVDNLCDMTQLQFLDFDSPRPDITGAI